MTSQRPVIIGVGGFMSGVGKTTLVCELLRAFPGWEAIKTTRGHYRSCGKDPHACCVSHLLDDEPVIRSGRELTYAPGKDTGRYWDSGAANVHWVIATDGQVEDGIREALSRVHANGVFVEGNSFTRFIKADYFVMVVRPDDMRIKSTAREILGRVSAFYLAGDAALDYKGSLKAFLAKANSGIMAHESTVFAGAELGQLIVSLCELNSSVAAQFQANQQKQERILSVP